MTRHHHSLLREGAITGFLGAGAVAGWFLLLDLVRGVPLETPSVLGQVLLFRSLAPTFGVVSWSAVAAYTAVHVGAFLLLGYAVTELIHLAVRAPIFQFVTLMLFVAFELFFVGITMMFLARTGGHFPIWSVLAANTLAAVSMGTYLWRSHPALRRQLERVPLGST